MNREFEFEAWSARARQEVPPRLDVAAGVLERIRNRSPRREIDVPLVALSGLSVLAASLMLVVAIDCWQSLTDPMAGLFSALSLVMQ